MALVAVAIAAGGLLAGYLTGNSEPAPAPLVTDESNLMSPAQREVIERFHHYLLADHDIDYRVVTVQGSGDINHHAVALFREFGRHTTSRSGRGLLLLIDTTSDQVRLEVGYPLEGTFTDAFVDDVERRQMVPFFESGRVADGILATTELIVSRLQDQGEPAVEAARDVASSGGGGAVTAARLGAGPAEAPAHPTGGPPPDAGESPASTLNAYFHAMAGQNATSDLPLYTEATRQMLAGWLMTPAQMDTLVRTYRNCHAEPALLSANGQRAVIRYPPAERACAPFFFQQHNGRWQLDLTMMQQAVRFGRSNAWHFAPQAQHPYEFGFADWRFDAQGFPVVAGVP